MSFGENLAKMRKELGMSQEELANMLNVSRQAVSKWESNSSYPETDKIVALCKIFNCSMDELIGLKHTEVGKEKRTFNKYMVLFNRFIDDCIKAIKLFYSMTFKQKIKCIIEMSFYLLVLFIIFLILNGIILEILRKILYMLPLELLHILINTIVGIFYILYLIFTVYLILKLYKVRYLDYYDKYLEKMAMEEEAAGTSDGLEDLDFSKLENDEKRIKANENIINVKEEKIIIRDPVEDFKPFAWIKKSFVIFMKFISCCIILSLLVTFVVLIALAIFMIYLVDYGNILWYLFLLIFGILLFIYLFLEVLVKYVLGIKQNVTKLFIIFIVSTLVIGASCGLVATALIDFKIIDKAPYDTLVYQKNISVDDALVLNFIDNYNVRIVHQERDDVLVEFYGTKYNDVREIEFYNYESTVSYYKGQKVPDTKFLVYDYYNTYYFNGRSFNDIFKSVLEYVKNNEIVTSEMLYDVETVVYISNSNYKLVMENLDKVINDYRYYDYE